eukprot:TRINITY_DN4963_c0_g1_i2.p1 TRINITY_DN4963_c0_g1~~TRINITY_DN4963_c0_g1_i2.p1  ORF type:complete len:185 (-),score=26.07 TRINITY_DN4963_c0_g1_i2:159-713(-)
MVPKQRRKIYQAQEETSGNEYCEQENDGDKQVEEQNSANIQTKTNLAQGEIQNTTSDNIQGQQEVDDNEVQNCSLEVFEDIIIEDMPYDDQINDNSNKRKVVNYKKFVKVWPKYMQQRISTTKNTESNKHQQVQVVQHQVQYEDYEEEVIDNEEFLKQEEERSKTMQLAEKMFNSTSKQVKRKQ